MQDWNEFNSIAKHIRAMNKTRRPQHKKIGMRKDRSYPVKYFVMD